MSLGQRRDRVIQPVQQQDWTKPWRPSGQPGEVGPRRQPDRAHRNACQRPASAARLPFAAGWRPAWRAPDQDRSVLLRDSGQSVQKSCRHDCSPDQEYPPGLQIDVIQALLHAAINFPGEEITVGVSRRYAGETLTDQLPVNESGTQTAVMPRRANRASLRSISGLPVVSRKSP